MFHLLSVSPALKSMEQRCTSKGKKASWKLQRRLVWNSVQGTPVQWRPAVALLQTSFVAERVFFATVQSGRALAPPHNSPAPDHRQPPPRVQRYLAAATVRHKPKHLQESRKTFSFAAATNLLVVSVLKNLNLFFVAAVESITGCQYLTISQNFFCNRTLCLKCGATLVLTRTYCYICNLHAVL